MWQKLIAHDLSQNKTVFATILFFISVAALLLSLAAMLSIQLFGAIDRLMETAKTPHFLQMHRGDIDEDALATFALASDAVIDYQVLPFLNLDNHAITRHGEPLSRSRQDNGFSVQSERFDLLLDLEGKAVKPAEGHVYLPIFYEKNSAVGETLMVADVPLKVAGYIRDSQMNSALAYSKRFLINQADYEKIVPYSDTEYLIEFRVDDLSEIGHLADAYAAADLPANGPTLTWPLFRMVNAISDGLMIAVLFIVSLLVILIGLACLRFVLTAKIASDYREIGVMLAIGIKRKTVRRMYLTVYASLASVGTILGSSLAFILHRKLLGSVQRNFGLVERGFGTIIAGFVTSILLFVLIFFYIRLQLRRFNHISPSEAVRYGMSLKASQKQKRVRLTRLPGLSPNLHLALSDVWRLKRRYVTMFAVIVLAIFMVLLPLYLHASLRSKSFVSYMGSGMADVRIDLQQRSDMQAEIQTIENKLQNDADVDTFVVLTSKTFLQRMDNGDTRRLIVELGDHTVFPVHYVSGHLPRNDEEIAFSSLYASDLDLAVGDQLTLNVDAKTSASRSAASMPTSQTAVKQPKRPLSLRTPTWPSALFHSG